MTHTPFEQMTKSSLKNFRQKSTDDLIQIWIKNEQNYQVSELNAVFHILLERGVEIPLPNDDQLRIENPNSSLIPPVKSNASLRELRPGKLEFRFPNEGFLHIGRFEFKDNDDLLSYLHQSFKGSIESQGIRGSITRKGKYQRVDDDSQPIFTFGDPVLDIITNRHGLLIIDGKVYNMRSQAIESGMQRGGISSMDLSPFLDDVSKTQVAKIAMGESNFVLLESSLDGITIASSNPSTLYFQKGSKRMRFRAWRTNLTAYWSMGAEIETWGGDFGRANIFGNYGDLLGSQSWCTYWYYDSDSDSNDDYVDEYEWGIFSRAFDSVSSRCTASWAGTYKSGTVSKGTCYAAAY